MKRDINENIAALIIHGFTVAHVIVGGLMGPAAGAVLTPMTAAMVMAIGTQCKASFNVQNAMKIMSIFVGFILGVSIAEFIVGLIPGIGNLANAIATGIVTELLGWATFLVLRDGIDERKSKLNIFQAIGLLKEANELRNQNAAFTQRLKDARDAMAESERKEYDRLMKIISDRDSSATEINDALDRAEGILARHGLSLRS